MEIKESEYKKRKETEFVINESEAKIVRMIFAEYVNGKSYKAITTKLNKICYKTKRVKRLRNRFNKRYIN